MCRCLDALGGVKSVGDGGAVSVALPDRACADLVREFGRAVMALSAETLVHEAVGVGRPAGVRERSARVDIGVGAQLLSPSY